MKKINLLVATIGLAASATAQTTGNSGVVTYEKNQKIEIVLSGSAAQYQSMLPKERKSQKELLFTSDASLFRNQEKQSDSEALQDSPGAGSFTVSFSEPEEFKYTDLKSKTSLDQKEYMSRTFLIESKTDTVQWKLSGNQKTILNLTCMEAELVGAQKKTTAWFTPTIPISTGPDGYNGLPGLILAMDIDGGKTTYTAKAIDIKEVAPALIKRPTKGKKVTYQEFKGIVEKQKKESGSSQHVFEITR